MGVPLGGRIGTYLDSMNLRFKGEYLRIVLAILALSICAKMAKDLLFQPVELYFFGS